MDYPDPLDYLDVFEAFGLALDPEQVDSLYFFAPVFAVPIGDRLRVLKRTRGPLDLALALADWERSLADVGVAVVEPVPEVGENPQELDEDVWVVYPFIDGEPYRADEEQLREAGRLLGRMHALPPGAPGLAEFDWGGRSPEELAGYRAGLEELPWRHGAGEAAAIAAIAAEWLDTHSDHAAWLCALELPEVDCSRDFKANNLVFAPGGPVLVDPDLAGRMPRVLDLALACLLFHNEVEGGEGRLLAPDDWDAFLDGYAEEVTLSPVEVAAWPEALRYMFVEQGLWLVFNEYEIEDDVQQAFMDDLLAFTLAPERYPLTADACDGSPG